MSFARYMQLALMHPDHGYYPRQTAFGSGGDFITAPDISQMFGEVIGFWLVDRWKAMRSPNAINLLELGGGRGALMRDIMRVIAHEPDLQKALQVFALEASVKRQEEQRDCTPDLTFIDTVDALPAEPLLVVSNEFFDALPVRQFVFQDARWWERTVGLSEDEVSLIDGLAPTGPEFELSALPASPPKQGDRLEINPQAEDVTRALSRHIAKHSGAALTIDYGYKATAYGDTVQAVRNHTYVPVLERPGEIDITAHVNFGRLQAVAASAGCQTFGPQDQGMFLMANGIGVRAKALAKGKTEAQQAQILADLKRLTAPEQMGTLFKAVCWQMKGLSKPIGF